MLVYRQRTWRIDADAPMHAESGYLRGPMDGRVELVVAQPTGYGEVAMLALREEHGTLVLDGSRTTLARTPSAKPVTDVRRTFRIDGDTLHYDLWMTYGDHEDTHHLSAVLNRA